jgi:hypothetical protein
MRWKRGRRSGNIEDRCGVRMRSGLPNLFPGRLGGTSSGWPRGRGSLVVTVLILLELQADCRAGVWGYHADRSRQLLEEGDIEEALRAPPAVSVTIVCSASHAAVWCLNPLPTAARSSGCAGLIAVCATARWNPATPLRAPNFEPNTRTGAQGSGARCPGSCAGTASPACRR